jgi:Skp family chaperone for outer membrane proteins
MKIVSILFAFLIISVGTFSGRAGEETAETGGIAWVDLPRVLKEYRRAEEMVSEFERDKATREAEVQKSIAEIERMEGEMLLLSEKARKTREEEIMKKKLSVNAMIEEAERELSRQSMLRQGKLLEEVSAAAEKVALREGYAFVLRGEVMLFKDSAREITEEVISELNRREKESNQE